MQSYKDQLAQARAVQTAPDLVVPFHTPEPGEEMVGILLGWEVVQNEKVKEPCMRYILDTDDGAISVLMGAATDKQLDGKLITGKLTYIQFVGKFESSDGSKMINRWRVQQYDFAPKDGDLGESEKPSKRK